VVIVLMVTMQMVTMQMVMLVMAGMLVVMVMMRFMIIVMVIASEMEMYQGIVTRVFMLMEMRAIERCRFHDKRSNKQQAKDISKHETQPRKREREPTGQEMRPANSILLSYSQKPQSETGKFQKCQMIVA
jgi:hypothetical protein